MFRGFHQQDSQEFLKYFLDQLHEELMEPISCTEDAEDDEESTPEQVKLWDKFSHLKLGEVLSMSFSKKFSYRLDGGIDLLYTLMKK